MPRCGEQRLGERAGRDAGRGLARARALEHVAGVGEAVLLHAREVGVAGPGLRAAASRSRPGAGDISSAHFPVAHSLLWITIATGEPSVRPWRTPPRNSTSSLLEAHARAAAVAEPAARQLGRDVVDEDRETGGQALDGDHQGRAVRLARGQEAQHVRKDR